MRIVYLEHRFRAETLERGFAQRRKDSAEMQRLLLMYSEIVIFN